MPKTPADLRSLARAHTAMGIKVLAGIASAADSPPAVRVQAIGMLFDRGWGRAPQVLSGEDGGAITVIIRQLVDVVEEPEPLLIEHETPRD